jgi:hypothetical protein
MNNDLPNSGDRSLDNLIGRYAAELIPLAPANLESQVWREIRARKTQQKQGSTVSRWFASALRLWQEPRLALACATAAVAVGVAMSWLDVAQARPSSARRALDLGVFSAEAPALPSTLLAHIHE